MRYCKLYHAPTISKIYSYIKFYLACKCIMFILGIQTSPGKGRGGGRSTGSARAQRPSTVYAGRRTQRAAYSTERRHRRNHSYSTVVPLARSKIGKKLDPASYKLSYISLY